MHKTVGRAHPKIWFEAPVVLRASFISFSASNLGEVLGLLNCRVCAVTVRMRAYKVKLGLPLVDDSSTQVSDVNLFWKGLLTDPALSLEAQVASVTLRTFYFPWLIYQL